MNYTKESVAKSLEVVKANLKQIQEYISKAEAKEDYQGVAALFNLKLSLEQTMLAGEFQLEAMEKAEQEQNANKQPN